jgi:hypothetical protein
MGDTPIPNIDVEYGTGVADAAAATGDGVATWPPPSPPPSEMIATAASHIELGH